MEQSKIIDTLETYHYDNAVDVVVRLHDSTDPSTESTTPLSSAHIQLDDVPRLLDPAKCQGSR